MTTRWAMLALAACGNEDDEEPTDGGTEPPECVDDTDCERLIASCDGGTCADDAHEPQWISVRTIAEDASPVSVRCLSKRFGSLAQVSVSVLDRTGDITPEAQGDAVLGEDFFVDGAVFVR